MKRQSLAPALLLLLTCSPAHASRYDTCPAYTAPKINVIPHFDEPHFDHSRSVRDLRNMTANNQYIDPSRGQVRGLTTYEKRVDSRYEIQLYTLPNGLVCAQISSFNLHLGVANTTVYVAREFPVETCSHQVIIDHELKHVAEARNILADYLAQSYDYVATFTRSVGMIQTPSTEEARNQLEQIVQQYTSPLSAEIDYAYRTRENAIDSPEEYQRIDASCNGEMKFLARHIMQ